MYVHDNYCFSFSHLQAAGVLRLGLQPAPGGEVPGEVGPHSRGGGRGDDPRAPHWPRGPVSPRGEGGVCGPATDPAEQGQAKVSCLWPHT